MKKLLFLIFAYLQISNAVLADDSSLLLQKLDSAELEIVNVKDKNDLIGYHIFLSTLYVDLDDLEGAEANLKLAYQKAIEQSDKKLQSIIVGKIGDLYASFKDNEQALNYFRRGLLIEKEIDNPDGVFNFHNKTGIAHQSLYQFEEARDAFSKALLVEGITNKDQKHGNMYAALGGLFRANLGKVNEGILYYKRALEIYKRITDSTNYAWMLNRIGNCNIDLGNYDVAYDLYQSAFKIHEKLNNQIGLVASFNNIGEIFRFYGDYSQALENYINGLQIAKEIKDDRAMSILFNNIGIIYYLQGTTKMALEYFDQSLEYGVDLIDVTGSVETYNYMGSTFGEIGDSDKALEYYNKSLKLAEDIGDMLGKSSALSSIGDYYLKQKKYKEANDSYTSAKSIAKSIKDRKGIVVSIIGISKIKIIRKQYVSAIQNLYASLKIAKEIGVKPQKANIFRMLSEANEGLDRHSRALNYYKKSSLLADSLQSSKISQQIEVIQQKYETERQEKEVTLLRQERKLQAIEIEKNAEQIENQNRRQIITGGGLLIMLVAAIIGWILFNERKKAFKTLTIQTKEIEEKNKSITDSIQYSKRIQSAFLTSNEYLTKVLSNHFIFYKPKDIVSGDFYWAYQLLNGKIIIAAVDCTGHGVPGALMSIIGISLLNESVMEHKLIHPEEILEELRNGIILSLKQNTVEHSNDGMDLSLIVWDRKTGELEFSGANNPLIIVRNGKIIEIKGDKQPIGIYSGQTKPFTRHHFKTETGDMLYLFTDGYADQFGGYNNKKFKTRNFKELLTSLANDEVESQKDRLGIEFENWKGEEEQLDDICVIGIKV